MKRIQRACPVCEGAKAEQLPAYSHPDWATVKCWDCGFVFLKEAPVYEALSEDLAWTKQFAKEAKRRREKTPVMSWLDRKTRWRLHMFRDNEWDYISAKVKTGNVLDVGCGTINHVPEKFTPFGIEIEKEAAAIANDLMSKKGGFVIHAPALEGLSKFDDGSLDGVIMRSYLEHEMKPRDVLRACHGKLKPGGVIYVKVPNFATVNRMVRGREWCGFRFPDHLNYFEPSSLKRLAEAEGYTMTVKNKATIFTNDNMHVFLEKRAS